MGFSFNWAGVNIPQIQVKDTTENAMRDADNIGRALRGYEVRQANKEYANLISSRNEALTKMDEISNRIAALQRRNEEIKAALSGMQQTAVQPDEGYKGEDLYPGGVATNLDPNMPKRVQTYPGERISGIPVENQFLFGR